MECAMALAAQGIATTLYEACAATGGQARTASCAPYRAGWRFVDFQRRQLDDAGAELRLGEAPTVDNLLRYSEVVFALGAVEAQPTLTGPLPSMNASQFLTAARVADGARVAVIDDGFGWWLGVGAVEAPILGGAREVTLVTPGVGFAGGLSLEQRTQLLQRLRGAPLRVTPLSAATRTVSEGILTTSVLDDAESLISADVVVAVGERVAVPPPNLGAGVTTRAIGDCVVPRRISHAVSEGRSAALLILETARRT
jgi:hypothetical protein